MRRVHPTRLLSTGLLVLALASVCVPAAGLVTGRWRLLPVLSGSMGSQLPVGSLALATREPVSSVHVGEVIVFNAPIGDHHLVAHRVVRVLRQGARPTVETKGDANTSADPWRAQLAGPSLWTVRGHVPLVGYAAVYARRSWGLLLLALAVSILLAFSLRALWRRPAHRREAPVEPVSARR
jgi:signal peptidase I